MKFDACKRCGRYVWNDDCRCALFQAAIPWREKVDEDDWTDVYALDTIIRNGEGEVWIRDVEGVVTQWDIRAETVPEYTATQRPAEGKTASQGEMK